MQSTSCADNCPFVKNKLCSSCKECPNYIESWWIPEEGSQPVKLDDCIPKRMLLQQQLLQVRFDQTTQALLESRNEYNVLCGYLKNLIDMSKSVIDGKKSNQIEDNNEKVRLLNDESISN